MDTDKSGFDRSTKTIVVVDDLEDLAETLVMLLEAEGYVACYALTGKAGMDLVSRLGAHAVLLDHMLPDMTGAEVGIQLCRDPKLSDLKILMYTSTPEEIVREIFDGYEAFLPKPGNHDRLMRALDGALAPALSPH